MSIEQDKVYRDQCLHWEIIQCIFVHVIVGIIITIITKDNKTDLDIWETCHLGEEIKSFQLVIIQHYKFYQKFLWQL